MPPPNATTGSGPSASFLGSDMRAAYYGGTALTGTGQNLALFEFLGTDLADLTTYYNNVGQTEPYTPTLISTGGYSTNCTESGRPEDDRPDIMASAGWPVLLNGVRAWRG